VKGQVRGTVMVRGILIVVSLVIVVGCASYETTYYIPDGKGNVVPKTVAGVPIVVTVPQKIGFLATEKRYLVTTRMEVNGRDTLARREITETTIDRTPIPLGGSQLANLDVKRPFYGTAKTKMKLKDHYPTELSSDVDDRTLDRALDTVDKLIEKQGEGNQTGGGVTKTLLGQRTYMIVYDPSTQEITRGM
jgi:hypothetical protein